MKKMLCLAIAFCLILSGCVSQTKPVPNVTVLEHNAIAITKQVTPATEGFLTNGEENYTHFVISPNDIIASVNKLAIEKGYKELTLLETPHKHNGMFTDDGDGWYILIDGYQNHTKSIELSLFTDGEKKSKMNGDYLYILMDIFNPGMQELISSELLIFDEAPEDFPRVREVICGNTTYRYTLGDNLIITATPLPEKPKEKIPSAIKPS